MALVPSNYAALIASNTGWVGPQFLQMASGIAIGVTTYLVSNPLNVVLSVDAGAPGAGVGNGVLLAPSAHPQVLFGLLETNLRGQGILGPNLSQFTNGLALATCAYLATSQTLTSHGGVGAGAGVGSIVGVEPAGMAAAILSATGFIGSHWPGMVAGISVALCLFLTTNVKYTIVISGPAGPGASAGSGTGRVF